MNTRLSSLLLCLLAVATASAQRGDGGISAEMLQQIRAAQTSRQADRAIANAIATNNIDDLARNPRNQRPVDTYFSVETPRQNIHNQKQSGRCWMFSGLNVLRSQFARKHKDTLRVEFSHAYLFFYDQLEKANLFLQGIIDTADKPVDSERVRFFFRTPLSDGGTFCGPTNTDWCRWRCSPRPIRLKTHAAPLPLSAPSCANTALSCAA